MKQVSISTIDSTANCCYSFIRRLKLFFYANYIMNHDEKPNFGNLNIGSENV